MPTVRFCCPAGVNGGADDVAKDDDVLLFATVRNSGDVPKTTKADHELKHGGELDLEGLDPESLPAIEHAVETDAAIICAKLYTTSSRRWKVARMTMMPPSTQTSFLF